MGVAWKIPPKAFGGLSAATKREFKRLAPSLEEEGTFGGSRC
jgi:hypothetical protein